MLGIGRIIYFYFDARYFVGRIIYFYFDARYDCQVWIPGFIARFCRIIYFYFDARYVYCQVL